MQTALAYNPAFDQSFLFTDPERRVFRAKEKLTVSQHAALHRVVVTGSATGKWTNGLTPYLIEPMDTWNLSYVRKIFLCFAPQVGKTSVAINCLFYAIDQDPGPAMYIMPDEKVAKRIAFRQLIPTMRATPRIAELMTDVSQLSVSFKNGMDLMMAWASSPAAIASESVRYMFYDEPAKYPEFSGKEADPLSLGDVRTNFYPYTSKQLFFSTPKEDGDPFDMLIKTEADEIRRYKARCPICQHLQAMRLENIHSQGCNDLKVVLRRKLGRYTCSKCGMDWDDYMRTKAVNAGRWTCDEPVERPLAVAFGPLESWYSPMVSLSKVEAEHIKSKNDPKKRIAFVTQHEARAYKEVIEPKEESTVLETHRTENPPMVVPPDVIALTAGIDVQKRGFWFVVRGWEEDLTSHLILYGYLSTFQDVDNLVFNTFFPVMNSNKTMGIFRAAMDTGGGKSDTEDWSRTEEIYTWITANGRGVVHAIKGASRRQIKRVTDPTQIIKLPRSNKPIPGGLELRFLDTFEFKNLIHWRLGRRDEHTDKDGSVIAAESQRFYLHGKTGMDYVRQLLAEEKRRSRNNKIKYVAIRKDNHLLDCEVYAAAAADREWLPNLAMLQTHLKEAMQSVQAVEKPDTDFTQTIRDRVVNFQRPDWLSRR